VSTKTILIVDGDTTSLNYLVHVLRDQGYSVLSADLGKEGLISTWRDHPDLIIFDPVFKDISSEEFLQKIRQDTRSANIPILALSSDPNPEKETTCLQTGCNHYVVKSAEAVKTLPEVIAGLLEPKHEAVAQEIIELEVEKTGGYLIVFLSAKGGTGTSSLCANYAMTMHHNKPEASVVVVDLVLPIGSIAPIVGYEGEVDLVSVAGLPLTETTGEYFHKHLPEMNLWEFQLVPGATDPERANQLQVKRIPEIIQVLQSAYDYVVIDFGRSLSRISLPIIKKADLLALTVSTDQSTITLTKKVWDYLHAQGIESQNVFAILNRAVGLEGLTKPEAEEIIGLPIQSVIPYMGSNFTLANNLNQPIITKYPEDTTSIILKDTTNNMINLADKLRSKQVLFQ
jgi:MinD-like ATPase involved in chromosome partitioning or flagellar assembly/ActR/RegA family two-component response regulator